MQRLLLLFALVTFCVVGLAEGQGATPGYPSFIPQDCGQYDCINLTNLSVSFNVPAMSKSGAFPLSLSLTGDDSYVYASSGALKSGALQSPLAIRANMLGLTGYTVAPTYTTPNVACPSGDGTGLATQSSEWKLTLADGTVHYLPLGDYTYSGPNCTGVFTGTVIDGTGYTVAVSLTGQSPVYDRSGAYLGAASGVTTFTDSNGNSIGIDSSTHTVQDTLGLTAVTLASNDLGGTWTDVNGNSPSVTTTQTSYTLRSAFGCLTDYNTPSTLLPTTVTFPDTTTLGIAYEATPGYSSDRTGRVSQLTLRSGSTVAFNYNPNNAANDGLNCTYLVPNSMTRTTSDGTVSYTLAYITEPGGQGYNYDFIGITDTKIDIGGNETVYTFAPFPQPEGGYAGPSQIPAVVQVQYFPNTGTVTNPTYSSTAAKTVTYCYNGNSTGCTSGATSTVNLPITEIDTYTNIGVAAGTSRQQTKFDAYGNVTYSAQYDFGATTPTQATTTVYGSSNGSGSCSAIGNNVNNKPCTVVTTLNGNTVAYSQYTYDSHGNLLRTYVSPNGGSSFLSNTTANVYNANGTPSVTYDLAGNSTTYAYSSGSYTACSTCTNFPFPTSMTTGGLTTSATYNGAGGVKLTHTDASGNTTTYGYEENCGSSADPWWRVGSIADPLGYEVCKSYSVTSLESSFEFNSSSSIQNVITTLDGYGRTINVQKQQGVGASNYDTVSTSRNFSGVNPTVFTSNPCSMTLGNSCTTYGPKNTYDMFGRLILSVQSGSNATDTITYNENDVLTVLTPAPSGENKKQVQNQYDGLGRLTSSCAISSNVSGNVSCGQNVATSPTSGILTTTTYSSAVGSQTATASRGPSNQQQRSVTTDGLGRITQKKTPEGGTWTYTYDAACSSSYTNTAGRLSKTVDPNGDTICYSYDALGRLLEANATNGTASSCRWFYYDNSTPYLGAVPSGITLTNQLGRMVEAATDGCQGTKSSSTLLTDEWFAYDKDGRQLYTWELTPNSTQYYKAGMTYTGPALTSVNFISPSLNTFSYGLDGEGRWNALTVGSTTYIPSSGVTYNAAGQPTNISIGTGTDYDSYSWDNNTLNMTGWTFQVNSVTETGVPAWNPSGSLKSLTITDGFNANGSITYSYNSSLVSGTGYDDLNRLIGFSATGAGGTWSQTFAFNDPYDNIKVTGTGLPSWNPGYSPTTNHYTCTGCTYDSNGNVTNDGTNAYTWNVFSKMASVNLSGTGCSTSGDCIVYDAFGRAVEFDDGSTKTEIWHSPVGDHYLNGATSLFGYESAPGGGTILGTGYMHKDWMGNARIISSVPASTITTDRSFTPYGVTFNIFGGTSQDQTMFAGLTQDILSGMYDTPNREMTAAQTRFMSPDPAGFGWNQYAYPTNPNSFVDPSGLDWCIQNGNGPQSCGQQNNDESMANLGGVGGSGPWFANGCNPLGGTPGSNCDSSGNQNGSVGADVSTGIAGQMVATFGTAPELQPGDCVFGTCDFTVPETDLTSQAAATGVADATAFDIFSFQIANLRGPNPFVTFATDSAGLVGIVAPNMTRQLHLGPLGAGASILNDPSNHLNIFTNLIGLVKGFDGPMAINGAFTDLFDYKMHEDPYNPLEGRSYVIPATVSNGEMSIPNPDLAPCGGWCDQ